MNTIDLETLAKQIAASEDVETEFYKIASTLDEQKKVTLAREVNKYNFLKNLQNQDLNEFIEFPLVTTDEMSKIASYEEKVENNKANLLKIASTKKSDDFKRIAIEKKASINSDMFVLKEEDVTRHKTKASAPEYQISKTANDRFYEELEHQQIQKEIEKQAEEQAIIGKGELVKTHLISKIASLTNDPSKFKSILHIAIKKDAEHLIPNIIDSSNVSDKELQKVASVPLDFELQTKASEAIQQLSELDRYIEKKAAPSINKIIRIVGKSTKPGIVVAKTTAKVGKGLGKQVLKHPLIAIGIGSAVEASGDTDKRILSNIYGY